MPEVRETLLPGAVNSPSSSPASVRPSPTAPTLGALAAGLVLITAIAGPVAARYGERLAVPRR